MAVLQVFEHQRVPVTDRPATQAGPNLSTAQGALLRQVERRLPTGAFTWGHESVKFAQFCGVVALGRDTLEILPKVYADGSDPEASRNVLVRMLHIARALPPLPHGLARLDLQRTDLLDCFIRHFCADLSQQLRKGMIRSYVRRVENLPVLRGKLLIGRQLRLNNVHKEKVWCEHDELISDNPPNRIFKCVLRRLLRIARSHATRRGVNELLFQFDSIADTAAIASDVDRVVLDRTTKRFEPAMRFCRWILAGSSPDVASGENEHLALLFDMNRLFETVVARQIQPVAARKGYRVRTQGPQKRLVRNHDTGEEIFTLKPDITLLDENGDVAMILDAKWKLLDGGSRKLGVSQADLYQMVGYSGRYRCGELALVYPRTERFEDKFVDLEVLGSATRVRICSVDLRQLTSRDWSMDWSAGLLP